ncbi:MAG: valine--tRNA ligase [Rickettsiales bacterium]|nr:valine--tRNA ligase [Rickettsiales bacterium]
MTFPELDKNFDHLEAEEKCKTLWEESEIYKYDPNSDKETFSVDTPPPYVSAAHLHVGHAMSYSQAEFVIRYHRMMGKNIFYPMGFDDNGLPTERYVENKYKINKKVTTRSEFRELCEKETQEGAKNYEKLWRSMGLSVDWRQRYSTIDEHCRRTSQASFIDLYKKGRIYRSDEPVLWDTHFETALAQADLDTLHRKGKLNDIAFKSADDGRQLVISTTRPELIPGCVALYVNPNDDRYKDIVGKNAVVPLFDYEVPIKTSEDVDPEFGTGLMMCCTFGDSEDVQKWKIDKLDTRIVIGKDGKMTDLAGEYAGKPIEEARANIIKALKEAELLIDQKVVDQAVSVAERSGKPVEFAMEPQWFIKVMDLKEEMLQRAKELTWFPEHMRVRLEDWINGLKYDWNISRQRFYGVPMPVWFTKDGDIVVPDEKHLPVDPLEDKYQGSDYNADELIGDPDVMDTWMTSSLSPLINANWVESEGRDGSMDKIYPMNVRVQAFEIIRTWLFYTVIKSHCHTDSLPWKDVMISGWGLNEQGKKISKRDLEKFTDKDGFNRYDPGSVVEKYGADALRYWAAGSQLGNDLRYNEKDVKAGRKLVVKMWNAARFVLMQLEGFDPANTTRPAPADRTSEDKWLLNELNQVVKRVNEGFAKYDYAKGREALERFFWGTFCDNYLEMVKDRFWNPERYSDEARVSAQSTLWEALRTLLGLYAPYLPFVTESLWQEIFKPYEESVSLHVTEFPQVNDAWDMQVSEMSLVLNVLNTVRKLRTQNQFSATAQVKKLIIDLSDAANDEADQIKALENSLQAVARAEAIDYGSATQECEGTKLKIGVEF